MTESALHPVQTWLWSELDDLGIDGVIYSRHILDLLVGSKHTFDHRLDEKEQNIFSKLAPGFKKKKHKYSRRSCSFSAYEEIIWKKEIAVACLLSAAETKAGDSEDTAATIQHVVDELYSKLAGLHLSSDGKSSSSDGDYSLNDCNGTGVTRKKSEKKENYEDAFPSLDGTKDSTVSTNLLDSVWNKSEKTGEPKSGRDSDNFFRSQLLGEEPCHFCCNSIRKGRFSPYFGSRSEGEATPDVIRRCNHTYRPTNSNRRFMNTGEPRTASTGCDDLQMVTDFRQSKKPPRFTSRNQFQSTYRKSECEKKKISGRSSLQKQKLAESENTFIQKSENPERGISSSPSKMSMTKITRNDLDDVEQDYAHLPSWMELTLADFSNPFIWNTFETFDVQGNGTKVVTQEEEGEPKEPAFSNRWCRDPDSGLLTYQPQKSAEEVPCSSSSSTTLGTSRPSPSFCEEDESFKNMVTDLVTPPALENWMLCPYPSPSVWEDGQTSPVSRLKSVYKRELMSIGTERHVDDICGTFWEKYKTIFEDLQSMDAGTDEEPSSEDDRQDSSVWGQSQMPHPASHNGGIPLPYSTRFAGENLDAVTDEEEEQSPFDRQDSSVWGPNEMPHPASHNGGIPLPYSTRFAGENLDAVTDEEPSSEEEQSPFYRQDSSVWGPNEMPHPASHNGGIPLPYSTRFDDANLDARTNEDPSSEEEQSPFGRQDSSVWGANNGGSLLPYLLRSVGANLGSEALGPEFNMWSRPLFADIESTVKRNQNNGSLATSAVGAWAVHNGLSSSTSVWNDSPVQSWSADDGLNQSNNSNRVQPDEELALLMQNGDFGYICPSGKSGWGSVTQKGTHHIAQSTQWGGGWASAIEKSETPEESSEEKMMHTIVDALFSDLLFGPDDEPHSNLDRNQIPSRTPVTPFYSEFPTPGSFDFHPFHYGFPTPVSFDFRSLFIQSPFQNFHSPNNNPWQPQWHLDDLVLRAGLNQHSPLIKFDDLFMSLAATEDRDHQYNRLGATSKKKKSFYDSVTENEAWRTSVRIGNIWQTISGIRPVNVIYSENKPGTRREEKLIPSSTTHFRPISPLGGEGNETPGYESTTSRDTSLTPDEPGLHDIGQDLSDKVNIPGMSSNEIGQIICPGVTKEPSFQTNLSSLVHDKSMQTSFDISDQQDISSCQEFIPRPPKASSR